MFNEEERRALLNNSSKESLIEKILELECQKEEYRMKLILLKKKTGRYSGK